MVLKTVPAGVPVLDDATWLELSSIEDKIVKTMRHTTTVGAENCASRSSTLPGP